MQDVARQDQHCCPEPGDEDAGRSVDLVPDVRVRVASCQLRERRTRQPPEPPDAAEPYKQAADRSAEQSFAVQAAAPLSGPLAAEQWLAPQAR